MQTLVHEPAHAHNLQDLRPSLQHTPVVDDVPRLLDELLVSIQHFDKADEQLVGVVTVHDEAKDTQHFPLVANDGVLDCLGRDKERTGNFQHEKWIPGLTPSIPRPRQIPSLTLVPGSSSVRGALSLRFHSRSKTMTISRTLTRVHSSSLHARKVAAAASFCRVNREQRGGGKR
eukprot:scaffold221994_cov21-Tisochrysis_lutea.AAC.1